jgi:hypothetical protein
MATYLKQQGADLIGSAVRQAAASKKQATDLASTKEAKKAAMKAAVSGGAADARQAAEEAAGMAKSDFLKRREAFKKKWDARKARWKARKDAVRDFQYKNAAKSLIPEVFREDMMSMSAKDILKEKRRLAQLRERLKYDHDGAMKDILDDLGTKDLGSWAAMHTEAVQKGEWTWESKKEQVRGSLQ